MCEAGAKGLTSGASSDANHESGPIKDTEPTDWTTHLYPGIWAKTARGVTLAQDEPPFHPLICHMIDVAMVARLLWQDLLPPALKAQIQRQLQVATEEEAGRWVAFFAGLHDLGKASPSFAMEWPDGWKRLHQEGFREAERKDAPTHGFITTHLLEKLLPQLGIPLKVARPIGFAVGGHHGAFPNYGLLRDIDRRIGKGRWNKARFNLVRLLAHLLEVDQLAPPQGALESHSAFLVILAGLTSVADWIGSNHLYFPFEGDEVQIPQYLCTAQRRALDALHDLGWFRRPGETTPPVFTEIFGKVPNRLQEQLIDLAPQFDGPSIILLEYPMGGGKTEGALYLAECLQMAAKQSGLYVALPTMATSNQMFERVATYIANRFPNMPINVQLLHGHADLHTEFELLKRRGRDLDEPPVIFGGKESALLAAEWFLAKKRGLLALLGIGTIDQALLAVLQTNHHFVRLFGLAGKVVILDEVHAYDTYMQSLLNTLLTWLAACGSSVILLSATLTRQTREALLTAYAAGLGEPISEMPQAPYPRISWVSPNGAGAEQVPDVPTHSVALEPKPQDGEEWMAALRTELDAGGCAAILCNTVARAQAVYTALQNYFTSDELLLFHARCPFDDRMATEQTVLRRFGKTATDRPHRAVCVATQVIEQSLDLDFDLMVTDLAPIDLLFQRSGRVWRHERPNRPTHFKERALWVLLPPTAEDGTPTFESGRWRVYDKHILLRSWLALEGRQSLAVPGDIEPLVEWVYTQTEPPLTLSTALAAAWRRTQQSLLRDETIAKREAESREIPTPTANLLEAPYDELDEEDEGLHNALRAMTRRGGPSVSVVCLTERDDGLWTRPAGGEAIRLEQQLNRDRVRQLLGRSLRISFDLGLVKRILEEEVPPTWRETAHLRRHRLLRFDPEGRCLTADLPLRLDPLLGLVQLAKGKEAGM